MGGGGAPPAGGRRAAEAGEARARRLAGRATERSETMK